MDVGTEEVANEGHALMYAADLVLICRTKEEARQRFVAWRNALESKGLKVNISKTKVMRCAWCTEGGSSGSMQCVWKEGSIHCATCGYGVHRRCLGVRGSLGRVAQGFVCQVCRGGEIKAANEFCFEDVRVRMCW